MRWATSPDHGARNIHNGSKPEGFVVISIPLSQVPWVGPDHHPFPTVNDCVSRTAVHMQRASRPSVRINREIRQYDYRGGHAVQIEPGLRSRSPKNGNIFKYSPETIGDFSLEVAKFGVWRPTANLQKPAIGGHFLHS